MLSAIGYTDFFLAFLFVSLFFLLQIIGSLAFSSLQKPGHLTPPFNSLQKEMTSHCYDGWITQISEVKQLCNGKINLQFYLVRISHCFLKTDKTRKSPLFWGVLRRTEGHISSFRVPSILYMVAIFSNAAAVWVLKGRLSPASRPHQAISGGMLYLS